MKIQSLRLPIGALAGVALALGPAFAQDMPTALLVADAAPTSAPAAPATPSPTPSIPPAETAAQPPGETPQNQAEQQTLSHEQLDQLVAPVALYPDQLLSQILMASTYPLEVVEAARWVGAPAHKGLRGDALLNAVKEQNWDPSVMALIPFPQVIALMDSKIDWTRQLGEAFVAQQGDVMDAVQRLRHMAQAAGNLKTTPECHCTVATQGDEITITAVENEPVCVPVYNSREVYGAWPYPDYPPDWFPLPVGFAFAPGFFIGFGPPIDVAFFGPLWGWSWIDWGSHRVGINPLRVAAFAPSHPGFAGRFWTHDPARGARAGLGGASLRGAEAGRGGARFGGTAGTRFGGTTGARFGGAAPFSRGGAAPIHNVAAFHGGAPAFRAGAAPAFHGGATVLRGSPAAPRGGAPAFHAGGGFHPAAIRGGGPAFHGGGGGHPAIAAAAHGGGAPHGGGGGGGHPGGGGDHHH